MEKPHFELSEFLVNCSQSEYHKVYSNFTILNNLFRLGCLMQHLRFLFDKPIVITSGYRDEEHNNRVGGVNDSQHLTGCACDFKVVGITDYHQFARTLQRIVEFDQLIAYKDFFHISYSSADHQRQQVIYK